MMNPVLFDCARTPERFLAYLDGELSVSEARLLDGHLEACPACRSETESLCDIDRNLCQRAAEFECMESDPVPAILAKARWDEASGALRRRRRWANRSRPPALVPWVVAAAAAVLLAAWASFSAPPEKPRAPEILSEPRTTFVPAPPNVHPPAPSPAVPVKEQAPIRGTFPSLPPAPAPKPGKSTRPPAPAPAPVPPPEPARPAPRPTVIAVARFEDVSGSVMIGEADASAGRRILAGETIEVGGRARIVCPDGTLLQIDGGARLRFTSSKKIELTRGVLLADVTPQPKGSQVVVSTPHADVKVLGTRLEVAAEPEATRVGVETGKVRVFRRRDGWSVLVRSGHRTLVADGVALRSVPRPKNLLVNAGFESGVQSWKWPLPTVSDPVRTGTLCQRIPAQRNWIETWQTVEVQADAAYSASSWIRTEGLDGQGAALRLLWLDAADRLIRADNFGWVKGTRPWTRVSGHATAPANAARMRFMVLIEGEPDGAGTAWFDDCTLSEPAP